MINLFSNLSPSLAVLIMAAIPTLESKVAIPFGLSTQIWGENVLSNFNAFLFALIGSFLPSIIVIFITRFIKKKTSLFVCDKIFRKIEEKYKNKADDINSRASVIKKCLALAFFVAIPLPLTGVYSGSLIAGFSSLKIWQGLISIFCGAIISCLIVLMLSTIFDNSAFYIFIISICLVGIFLIANLALSIYKKIKKEKR